MGSWGVKLKLKSKKWSQNLIGGLVADLQSFCPIFVRRGQVPMWYLKTTPQGEEGKTGTETSRKAGAEKRKFLPVLIRLSRSYIVFLRFIDLDII